MDQSPLEQDGCIRLGLARQQGLHELHVTGRQTQIDRLEQIHCRGLRFVSHQLRGPEGHKSPRLRLAENRPHHALPAIRGNKEPLLNGDRLDLLAMFRVAQPLEDQPERRLAILGRHFPNLNLRPRQGGIHDGDADYIMYFCCRLVGWVERSEPHQPELG
ncbi:MAG: hypothetical protein ABR915_18980 [Thermoguttaceae bacterium]